MAQAIKKLVVATGEYTNVQGETKKRWLNVGTLFKSDDGGVFLTLSKTFNPAGIETDAGRDSILISCFDMDENKQAPAQPAAPVVPSADVPF